MEPRKREIIDAALRRFSRGDLDGTLELIHPDVIWEPSGAFIGSGREYRRHSGVRSFWSAFREPWLTITLEATDATELDGDRLLTRTRFRGIGRSSGVETEMDLTHVWTVHDGKIARFQSFETEADALAAAGRERSAGVPRPT